MSVHQWINFSKATISGTLFSGDTALNLVAGQGNRFPSATFDFIVWNETDFPDPSDAYWSGAAEIMRCDTDPTANGFPSILRGREGTSALNFDDTTKVYRVMAAATASWMGNQIQKDLTTSAWTAVQTGASANVLQDDETLILADPNDAVISLVSGVSSVGELRLGDSSGTYGSLRGNTDGNGRIDFRIADPNLNTISIDEHGLLIGGCNQFRMFSLGTPLVVTSNTVDACNIVLNIDSTAGSVTIDAATITGSRAFHILYNDGGDNTVTVRHNSNGGNILLAGGSDFALDTKWDSIGFIERSGKLVELFRSNCPAT